MTLASVNSARAGEQVTVGAYVHDIHSMDLRNHSFHADIYVWFKWKKPDIDPAASVEVMNPAELWALSRVPSYDQPVELPSGERLQVLRFQGNFAEKFDLTNYPFDPQSVHIDFEDSRDDKTALAYVADQAGITINPKLRLPGYQIGKPKLLIEDISYPTAFGDTRPEFTGRVYSRIRLEMPITRPVLPNALKLLIPLLCVVFCASLMYLFKPPHVDARVGIGITALLTVVALQITLNEDLPEVDYIVLIDKLYLLTYLYVIAGLAIVVKTTWMLDGGALELERAIKLDRRYLILLTAVYGVIVGVLLLFALL